MILVFGASAGIRGESQIQGHNLRFVTPQRRQGAFAVAHYGYFGAFVKTPAHLAL